MLGYEIKNLFENEVFVIKCIKMLEVDNFEINNGIKKTTPIEKCFRNISLEKETENLEEVVIKESPIKTLNSEVLYLIGSQIARILNKETFNLYRSMKIKGVEIIKANLDQLRWLKDNDVIESYTRSVTLINYEEGLNHLTSIFNKMDTEPTYKGHFSSKKSKSKKKLCKKFKKRIYKGCDISSDCYLDDNYHKSKKQKLQNNSQKDIPTWEILLSLNVPRIKLLN